MSTYVSTFTRSSDRVVRPRMRFAGVILATVIVAGVIFAVWRNRPVATGEIAASVAAAAEPTPATQPRIVRLSPHKLASANIHTAPAATTTIQESRTIPGRITYDETRKLDVTSPVDGTVKEVFVETGQRVRKGDKLLAISSKEVGLARSDLQTRQAELDIAETAFQWAESTATHVSELVDYLDESPTVAEIRERFADKTLGDHREHIVAAYSQLLLARSMANQGRSLGGVVAGRDLMQRENALDSASAAFQSACEQSAYESGISRAQAKKDFDDCQRQFAICRERLEVLLGPDGKTLDDGALSDLVLCANMDGRIEDRPVVPGMRLKNGQRLLLVADTSRLWVAAEVDQQNWNALSAAEGQELTILLPAKPDEEYTATVRFVGAAVSMDTRTIPLVADIDNSLGELKPGMFTWITVPVAEARNGITVPTAAIQRHEGHAFVFVQSAPDSFRRSDVTVGLETPQRTEILTGLAENDVVVDQGAFYLTAELLLEREAD